MHLFVVAQCLSQCKLEPATGRGGREVPQPPAMTLVVREGLRKPTHRGWSRSTVGPRTSDAVFCFAQDTMHLRFFVAVPSFV